MKRLLIFIFLFIFALPCLGQVYTCVNIDGYWGKWENSQYYYTKGTTDNFIIYHTWRHPSEYTFKVVISNYFRPDNKTKRRHWKNNEWYEYSGYVEWRMPDNYEIKDALYAFPNCPSSTKYKKIKLQATIKIAPYKKVPSVYNVWIKGYGYGLGIDRY